MGGWAPRCAPRSRRIPSSQLVAAVDPYHDGIELRQLGVEVDGLRVARTADALLEAGADVAVDFTVVEAARKNILWCADNGVHAVVGTTGFEQPDLDDFAVRFDKSEANAILSANFALGAVLMMRFAAMAAPYFESAEVIELHHDQKVDAPSGTAMVTAQRMADASANWADDPTEKEVVEGSRGGVGPGGIRIHAVRLRGLVSHQEVVLGTAGQSLTIRHDSYDRTSFMPGVLLAVKAVADHPGLTIGLDALLGD